MELETKINLIANLERENNQLRSLFKKKGNNNKTSKLSVDNNYYRKLPQAPSRF